jgi:hypothetical protein
MIKEVPLYKKIKKRIVLLIMAVSVCFLFGHVAAQVTGKTSEYEKLQADHQKGVDSFQKKRKDLEVKQEALRQMQYNEMEEYKKGYVKQDKALNDELAAVMMQHDREVKALQATLEQSAKTRKDYEKYSTAFQLELKKYTKTQQDTRDRKVALQKKYADWMNAHRKKIQDNQDAYAQNYTRLLEGQRALVASHGDKVKGLYGGTPQIKDDPMPFKHQRAVSKSYTGQNKTLQIQSKFSNIKIVTWDKNEIKVDVQVTTSSSNQEMAASTFKEIDIKESIAGNNIKLETILPGAGDGSVRKCSNCKNEIAIYITIQMPANIPLRIVNSFGNVIVPDYSGSLSLDVSYGSLTAGELSAIDRLNVVDGTVKISSAKNTTAFFKNTSIQIDELAGNVAMQMQFCTNTSLGITNRLQSLTLNASNGKIKLLPASDFSGAYEMGTDHGSFSNHTNTIFKNNTASSGNAAGQIVKHMGKAGAGTRKVNVVSTFSALQLGENHK